MLTSGLPRGESTASAMENRLSVLERKIDDLLASVDTGIDTDTVAHITNGKARGTMENKGE